MAEEQKLEERGMRIKITPTNPKLLELLRKSVEAVDAMTKEEREAMHKAQCESWVRGEMGWPAPRYKFVNGVKVYESYEDYCA